jgi:hypothetical protein
MRPGRRERAQPPLQQGYESTTQWNFKTHWCFHSGEVPRHFFTTWSKAQALLVAASFAAASQVQNPVFFTDCSGLMNKGLMNVHHPEYVFAVSCLQKSLSGMTGSWDVGSRKHVGKAPSFLLVLVLRALPRCHRCCSRKGGDAAAAVPACREKHRVGSDRDTPPSIHSCQSPSLFLSAKTPAWNFRLFLQNLLNLDTPFYPSSMKHYCLDVSFKDRTYFKFIGFYQNNI